jgi:hypothetical protein
MRDPGTGWVYEEISAIVIRPPVYYSRLKYTKTLGRSLNCSVNFVREIGLACQSRELRLIFFEQTNLFQIHKNHDCFFYLQILQFFSFEKFK